MESKTLHAYLIRLVWVCITPLLVLLVIFAAIFLKDIHSDQQHEAAVLARNVATLIEDQLEARISGLKMLAISPLIRDRTRWRELYEEAQGYRQAFGSHVILAEAAGQMLFNTRVPFGSALPLLPKVRGNAAAPTALATGRPAVGDQFMGPVAKETLVAIAVPIHVDGRIPYLLVVTLEADYFQHRIHDLTVSAGGTATLLDGRGEIIARKGAAAGLPLPGGTNRIALPLKNAPWSVVIESQGLLQSQPMAIAAILLSLMILAVGITSYAGGRFVSRRLTQALDTLVSGLRKTALPSGSGIAEIDSIGRKLFVLDEQRQQSESNLKESERRLRLAQEAARAGTWEWDVVTNVNYWSDEVYRLYGYTAGGCSAGYESWLESVQPENRDEVARAVAEASQRAKPIRIEWRANLPDGELRWLMSRGEPQFDAEGRLVRYLGIVMDITDRKLAEQQLQLWGEAFEKSDVGLAIGDPQHQVIRAVNPAIARRLGYTREELIGRPVSFAFPTDRLSEAIDQIRKASETGHANFESEHLRKDGTRFPVFLDITVVKDVLGRPLSRFVVAIDITERKIAEARLLESEARLRSLVDTIPDLVWLKDPNGVYLACNNRFEQFFGAAKTEIIGRTDHDFLPAEEVEFFRARDRDAVAAGGPTMNEEEIVFASDGHRELLQTIKTPIYEADGRLIGVLGVGRDITELRKNEEELRAHRSHLEQLVKERSAEVEAARYRTQQIIDSSADGIIGLDLQGCVTQCNPAALSMLGYRREQLIGRNFHEVIHYKDADGRTTPVEQCAIIKATQKGRTFRLERDVFWSADGRPIPVALATHPIIENDRVIGGVMNFQDISDRLKLEEAREEARLAAERLARTKSEFLANMSHEIRTPLGGVLGLAQIGYRDSDGQDKVRKTFRQILDSGKLLLTVIDDILDFSKIEAGKLAVESVAYAPRTLAQECAELMRARAVAKGLRLDLDLEPLPSGCLGDPVRIQQILLNLLSNAIKFTDAGSVRLSARYAEGALLFQVSDTGIGIAPDALARLFQPFEQADSSTTRRFGGTGLGLVISRRLADLMGGSLAVAASTPAGTTFELRVPAAETQAPVAAEEPALTNAKRLAGLRILAADDVELNRVILEDFLVAEGADVVVVENGAAAVAAVAQQGPFDAVLMDVQMPVLDGFEATRQILAAHPGLPIIGQTAHALQFEHDKCLAAGMVATLTKPITVEALVAAILGQTAYGRAGSGTSMRPATSSPVPAAAAVHPVDWAGLKRSLAGNEGLLGRLCEITRGSHGGDAAMLRRLAGEQKYEGIYDLAHALKGIAGIVCATALEARARQLMLDAHERNPETIALALEVADMVEQVLQALEQGESNQV